MALPRHFLIPTAQAVVALGFVSAFCPLNSRAQIVTATAAQVDTLRAEIKAAEARHADAGRLGHLWRDVGIAYESQLDEDAALDAYAHAIPLLRASGCESEYADTLHGLGSVYLNMQRRDDARKYMLAALAIYEKQGDHVKASFLHQTIGISWLFDSKYKEATSEFSAAVSDINQSPDGQPEPMIGSYLLRAGAEYHSGDTERALQDIAEARKVAAPLQLAPNSIETIGMSLAEGAALTRLGHGDTGDALIQQALEQLSTRNDFSEALRQKMRIAILREYGWALAAAHRKREAKGVEAQAAMLQSKLPGACAGCTVSVSTLGLAGLR